MRVKHNNQYYIGSAAQPLARWILVNCNDVTNLKLQKLLFYCYGAALAFDFDDEVGQFAFEAWKYGPVERTVYKTYSQYEANQIPKPSNSATLSLGLESKLRSILKIYGSLTPMELVRQSHLEAPWIAAWNNNGAPISSASIKKHFKAKFVSNPIEYPEVILDSGIFQIDNIPVQKFSSIEELADALNAEEIL